MPSLACGVGHVSRFGNRPGAHADSGVIVAAIAEQARGVGKLTDEPEPIAAVGRAGVTSSEHTPARIVPQRGQVPENDSEAAAGEEGAVFHEHESRSHLTDDPRHVPPEARTGAGDACPVAGAGDVLTGEAARQNVNTASPRSAVKGAHVIPDRERREAPVVLASHENACGVGVALDGTDGAPAEQVTAEDASTSAREKSQLIQCILHA